MQLSVGGYLVASLVRNNRNFSVSFWTPCHPGV